MRTLNLGILAHVDAGKTTLTERLLFAAGVIDKLGSVDDGTTQTDTLDLERQRGITIKAAVVSFGVGDTTVNLIDTPGHPDFIAEVERVLGVLDGAVLVISAVEGVQPQTQILMRALQRMRVPTLLFVNKIDRPGADTDRVLEAISRRLTPAIVPLGTTTELGTRDAAFPPGRPDDPAFRAALAEVLAEHDEGILAAFVDSEAGATYPRLRRSLVAQARAAELHPVLFGSALTGAGVDTLLAELPELLPSIEHDAAGPVSGTIFKIDRGAAGEKVAYVALASGTVRTRERVAFGADAESKVTAIKVFADGGSHAAAAVAAGQIGQLWGLHEARIGDVIGLERAPAARQFAPPVLESVVTPVRPADSTRLRVALAQLAEQDPLINVRQDAAGAISVSLYGEVQKEVIGATLANDFGVDVSFRETTTICVERLVKRGEAVELLETPANPFMATIGLRLDPAPAGSGITFRLDVEPGDVPLYIYKTANRFSDLMAQYVRETLEEGLYGWKVPDCAVTMTKSGYYVGDGLGKRAPATPLPYPVAGDKTAAADFRKLIPIVVMRALQDAGPVVCEPVARLSLEVPEDTAGGVGQALGRLHARVRGSHRSGGIARIQAIAPLGAVREVQAALPGLTRGEGIVDSDFEGFEPVFGTTPPSRRRTTPNALDVVEYMAQLGRRGGEA
jgi:ribosomal protection tetracycline resistance protein